MSQHGKRQITPCVHSYQHSLQGQCPHVCMQIFSLTESQISKIYCDTGNKSGGRGSQWSGWLCRISHHLDNRRHSLLVNTASMTHPDPAESSGVTLDAETHKVMLRYGPTGQKNKLVGCRVKLTKCKPAANSRSWISPAECTNLNMLSVYQNNMSAGLQATCVTAAGKNTLHKLV